MIMCLRIYLRSLSCLHCSRETTRGHMSDQEDTEGGSTETLLDLLIHSETSLSVRYYMCSVSGPLYSSLCFYSLI